MMNFEAAILELRRVCFNGEDYVMRDAIIEEFNRLKSRIVHLEKRLLETKDEAEKFRRLGAAEMRAQCAEVATGYLSSVPVAHSLVERTPRALGHLDGETFAAKTIADHIQALVP